MKKSILSIVALSCAISLTTSSCSTGSNDKPKAPYEIMSVAFEGSPRESEIKPMLEAVMDKYNFTVTDENCLKVGNMLVELRKMSAVGVTEMDILKHMYQNGSDDVTIDQQAAVSATILETTK